MGGEGIPNESHAGFEELLVVIEGQMTLVVNETTFLLEAGDYYLVPKEAVHRVLPGSHGHCGPRPSGPQGGDVQPGRSELCDDRRNDERCASIGRQRDWHIGQFVRQRMLAALQYQLLVSQRNVSPAGQHVIDTVIQVVQLRLGAKHHRHAQAFHLQRIVLKGCLAHKAVTHRARNMHILTEAQLRCTLAVFNVQRLAVNAFQHKTVVLQVLCSHGTFIRRLGTARQHNARQHQ
ncbi:hypothetical protein BBAD15_g8600 [Beauveria bassiana D1-5]|uniref:Cupin type-2 domain-containing protein n=1 Tax=Beauveria bassiana D1-5 TaxID=1245745 RepID=A0A0A2VIZ1_BEABA|nr:hypothetical protein BBAD15_g8600 [Beauveria bassiana D1-5]